MAKPIKQLQVGQLVRSLAGHDKGQYYLVLKVAGVTVWLVDGYKRLPANAKQKNPCHLQESKLISADFAAKAQAGNLRPEDLRACLRALLSQQADELNVGKNPDEEALANV